MDPKGTYYSPSETGWATVLRPGPNFLGMAQQQQALAARREQAKMQAEAKAQAEREKQIFKIAGDMAKPVSTAFPYQETVNAMKDDGLKELQDMFLKNEDMSKIRFKSAELVQNITSYAASGKQVYDGIKTQVDGLGPEFKKDAVLQAAASKLVGPDAKPIDPQTINAEDLNIDAIIYESEKPWEYLNENVVLKNFLKSDAFKEQAMEIQRKLDAGQVGRFMEFGKQTTIQKYTDKIFSVDAISGQVKINDPDTLIANGTFQMMLNDRNMAAVVDKYVNELTADRTTPLEESVKDDLRASVLRDLLVNNVPGPQTIERVQYKYSPKSASSGSSMPQWMIDDNKYKSGVNVWQQHVASGDPKLVNQALEHINVQLGISDDARALVTEAVGADPDSELLEVKAISAGDVSGLPVWQRPAPGVYAVFKEGKKIKRIKIDQEKLAGVFGAQIYAKAFKNTGSHYLDGAGLGAQQSTMNQSGASEVGELIKFNGKKKQ